MIWLVGSRGMLGTEVARQLEASRLPFVSSDMEVDITKAPEIRRFVDANLRDGLAWIINCAAYTAVDRAEDEADKARAVNAAAVGNLAEAARDRNASVVHISTDYVYSGAKSGAYLETDETSPIGVYGRTKLEGEQLLASALDRHCILRTSWLFGLHGANFVRTMLRLFAEKPQVSVVSDQWGSPTYAVDLARAIVTVVTRPQGSYGIYHFANEGRTNWFEFAGEISRQAVAAGLVAGPATIRPIRTDEYPSKAKRPPNSYMSKEKFRTTFGFEIRPWQQALAAFVEELRGAQTQ